MILKTSKKLTMTYLVMGLKVILNLRVSLHHKDEGSTDDDFTSSDDEEIIVNQQPKNRKKQATDSPDGWDMKLWKKGDTKLQPLPKFTAEWLHGIK